jgi:hypothetical protein
MTEQRAGWLQRLVGADGGALTALEQQLHQLQEELGRERDERARVDQELALARDLAAASEQDFETKLRAAQASVEQRQAAQEALEVQQKQSASELQITRNQLSRQRDESSKLTKSLAATNAQLERAERATQESRARLTELEGKLAERTQEATDASARAATLEGAREASSKELADSLRRLQDREARSSILEHELAQTKLALKSAETELQVVATRAANADRERAFAVAVGEESWRALGHVLGDASTLALSLGVDAGPVDACDSLPDAAAALKLALERRGLAGALSLDSVDDGMWLVLKAPDLGEAAAPVAWFAAFASCFLGASLGVELCVEETQVEVGAWKARLRASARAK